MPDIETRLQNIERRMSRMIQTGVIVDADYDAARVRVAVDKRTSDWIAWATRRAGGDIDWWAPEVGEQVDLLCPNGEMNGARVIPAFYSDQVSAPANSADVHRIQHADGAHFEYNRATSLWDIYTPGDVRLVADGNVAATVGKNVTAQITGTADVTAQGAVALTTPTSVTITAPQTTVTGKLTVQGLLTYVGGMAGSGGSGAAATIDGTVKATGDVTAGSVSLNSHTHPGDSGGTTGGPN